MADIMSLATNPERIIPRVVDSRMGSERTFFGVSTLLFAASAGLTILWCGSMSAMAGVPMPGGWTMSMVWTPMCGQTWLGAAASFLGMWVVMMVAMMLPSLVPMLWRYRQAVGGTSGTRLDLLTALVGVVYFLVWTAYLEWPSFHWASRWPILRCSSQRWRAPFRLRSA